MYSFRKNLSDIVNEVQFSIIKRYWELDTKNENVLPSEIDADFISKYLQINKSFLKLNLMNLSDKSDIPMRVKKDKNIYSVT